MGLYEKQGSRRNRDTPLRQRSDELCSADQITRNLACTNAEPVTQVEGSPPLLLVSNRALKLNNNEYEIKELSSNLIEPSVDFSLSTRIQFLVQFYVNEALSVTTADVKNCIFETRLKNCLGHTKI